MEQENWNLFTWIFRGTVETIRISIATIITISLICMRDKFVPFIAAYFVNGKILDMKLVEVIKLCIGLPSSTSLEQLLLLLLSPFIVY